MCAHVRVYSTIWSQLILGKKDSDIRKRVIYIIYIWLCVLSQVH